MTQYGNLSDNLKPRKSTHILGINSFFEHPAVAIISDGELVFAMEDERLTRIKHGKSYTPYKTFIPYDTIYAALKSQGLRVSDLDEVAYSYNRWEHLKGITGCFTGQRLSSFREEMQAFRMVSNVKPALSSGYELLQRYRDRINPEDFKAVPYKEWDHHSSHAASAFFYSGYKDALVVVADGSGEKACTSIYVGSSNGIKKIKQISLPHSLGFFYSFMTSYLGFEPYSDEYKVMGLAAYGQDTFAKEMKQLLQTRPEGGYYLDLDNARNLEKVFGQKRKYGEPIDQKYADIAKSAQVRLEEVLLHVVDYHLQATGQSNLCLAGGTFLNILANARLADLPRVKQLYVQPAAHDAGTAIGAAALSWIQRGGQPQISHGSMCLGTEHSDDEIEKVLKQANATYERYDNENMIAKVAQLLADEKIVGLYRGRIEFGPRALGNRSIIASPKSERTREKLNELKVREQFRPLAPIVTEEAFEHFFDGHPNRYMMLKVSVKENMKEQIPAVVHADGSARSQVINQEHDPFLHKLLTEFEKLKGIPVLINTSLNVRGRPIDESPSDALASFYTSGIDYIMMGKFLVKNLQQHTPKQKPFPSP